jgi:DNA-binding MarR family transcriptional regulator
MTTGVDHVTEVGQAFKAAIGAVRRLRGRETHHTGELSHAQFWLLFALADSDALSSREVACSADLSPATVTEMLDSLAAVGLVERVRSDQDKRVVLTSLTKRGRELVAERRSDIEARWRAALDEFSAEELVAAAAVLDRVRAMFEELAEHPQA